MHPTAASSDSGCTIEREEIGSDTNRFSCTIEATNLQRLQSTDNLRSPGKCILEEVFLLQYKNKRLYIYGQRACNALPKWHPTRLPTLAKIRACQVQNSQTKNKRGLHAPCGFLPSAEQQRPSQRCTNRISRTRSVHPTLIRLYTQP